MNETDLRTLAEGLAKRIEFDDPVGRLARDYLAILTEKGVVERERRHWKDMHDAAANQRDKAEEDAERRAGEILGVVQRFQPGGSPPPGGPVELVWWIMKTLNGRAEKAEAALKIVAEGLKVWPPDERPGLAAAQVILGREGLKILHDALRALEGREEKP